MIRVNVTSIPQRRFIVRPVSDPEESGVFALGIPVVTDIDVTGIKKKNFVELA